MNFLFLSYRGPGLSPLKLPSETVLVFSCPAQGREEPASQRSLSSQVGLVELGAGGELRHSPVQP